ncbi:MAG: LPS-assembly lipoprotein LptE [Sulfuriferula sp.]
MKILIQPWFFLSLMISLTMMGCGFHLRAQVDIPFTSVYVDGSGASPVVTDLRQMITAGGHKDRLAKSSISAERTIQIMSDSSTMIIIALNGAGQVAEYQLQYRVKYRLLAHDKEVLKPVEIVLSRDMSYNNSQPYAYGDEENFLYHDMQTDAAQQILRRIALLHK